MIDTFKTKSTVTVTSKPLSILPDISAKSVRHNLLCTLWVCSLNRFLWDDCTYQPRIGQKIAHECKRMIGFTVL